MATILTVLFLTISLADPLDDADRPPKLTFDKKVDYFAWWNERISRGKNANTFDAYVKLRQELDAIGSLNNGFPPGDGELEAQGAKAKYAAWLAYDLPRLTAHIRKYDPLLRQFCNVAKRGDYWIPATENDAKLLMQLNISQPDVECVRSVAKLLALQSWKKIDGQKENFLVTHESILRAAHPIQSGGGLSCLLAGRMLQVIAYESIVLSLKQWILQPRDAKSLYVLIQKSDPAPPDFRLAMLAEWASMLDAIQFVYNQRKPHLAKVDEYFPPEDKLDEILNDALKAAASQDLEQSRQSVEEFFTSSMQAIEGEPSGAKAKKLRSLVRETRVFKRGFVLMRKQLPLYPKAYELSLRGEAMRRGVLVVLAFTAHRHETGNWPTTLDDIDPRLGLDDLTTLRRDPYSGEPFRYQIRDGQPWLWSIGADGKDNQGRHDSKWGEGKNGGDFVIWPYGGAK